LVSPPVQPTPATRNMTRSRAFPGNMKRRNHDDGPAFKPRAERRPSYNRWHNRTGGRDPSRGLRPQLTPGKRKGCVRLDLAQALLHERPEAFVKRPLFVLLALASCTSGSSSTSDTEAALRSVGAIAVLQRAPRMSSVGDVFQYTSYVPGAHIVKLSPP